MGTRVLIQGAPEKITSQRVEGGDFPTKRSHQTDHPQVKLAVQSPWEPVSSMALTVPAGAKDADTVKFLHEAKH